MSYFEFPHTREYNGDLGYIIKKLEELNARYNNFFDYNSIKFHDPITWNIETVYTAFEIVYDDQTEAFYISKTATPAGIDISNSNYWLLVTPFKTDVDFNANSINPIANKPVTLRFNAIETDVDALNTSLANALLEISANSQAITNEANTRATADNTINARIDEILDGASVDPDAELLDIRVGGNGRTYSSAGGAVRGQYDELIQYISILRESNLFDSDDAIADKRIDGAGNIITDTNGYYVSDYMPVTGGVKYYKNSNVEDAYHRISYFDSNKVLIAGSMSSDNITTAPNNARYAVICFPDDDLSSVLFITATAYDNIARSLIETNYNNSVHIMPSNNGLSDFNDAEINRIYLIISIAGVDNLPINESGLLVTIARNVSGRLQIYNTENNKIFTRTYWAGSWSDWVENNKYFDVLHAFTNIVCCGDSLTYSQVFTADDDSRRAYKTYPDALAEITGAHVDSIAVPGYSASDFWHNKENDITARTNGLAIIYLGANGGLTDTLDSDAPSGIDYQYWADTNTGNYCKIVAKWLSLGLRVCLVKCYSTSGTGSSNLETTNAVIDKIGVRFGCGVAENKRLTNAAYHLYPNLSGYNEVHYNDIGYSAFAEMLVRNIALMDRLKLQYLIPS